MKERITRVTGPVLTMLFFFSTVLSAYSAETLFYDWNPTDSFFLNSSADGPYADTFGWATSGGDMLVAMEGHIGSGTVAQGAQISGGIILSAYDEYSPATVDFTLTLKKNGTPIGNTIIAAVPEDDIFREYAIVFIVTDSFTSSDNLLWEVSSLGGLGEERAMQISRTSPAFSQLVFPVTGEVATYVVSYDGNGNSSGSVPVDSNRYAEGAIVTVLGNTGTLTQINSTFAGWNSAANGTAEQYASGDTFSMGSSSVMLYAQWEQEEPGKEFLWGMFLPAILSSVNVPEEEGFLYPGGWQGVFSGTDRGTWSVTIDAQGVITGSGYSNDLHDNFTLTGTVDGQNMFHAEAFTAGGASTGGEFSGVVVAPGVVSGTWVNRRYTSEYGTFEGSRTTRF